MTSGEWAAAITAIAFLIAKDKSPEELTFLAALLMQLSDTLATLALTPPNNCK
jgi:hypothetical protein